MALPSAQLGQLPGMNSPTYIPTVVVPKEPKFWEKVLMQTLANAASGVASHGIENAMSRDYADTTAGETPATGFSKFWQGPKVTEREQEQRVANRAADTRQSRQLNTELAIADMGQQVSPKDFFNRATQQAITGAELGSREKIAGMESGDRAAGRTSEEKRTQAVIDAENLRAANNLALQKIIEDARAKLLGEQTTTAALQNKLLSGAVDKSNPPPKPAPTPSAPSYPSEDAQKLLMIKSLQQDYPTMSPEDLMKLITFAPSGSDQWEQPTTQTAPSAQDILNEMNRRAVLGNIPSFSRGY